MVEDAPRRSADDARAFFECADLLLHRSAAIDGDGVDAAAGSELRNLTRALQSQLSRWGEEEGLFVPVIREQSIDERNSERAGLSCARPGLHDEVVSGDGQRIGVTLHRSRGFPTHFSDRFEHVLVYAKICERLGAFLFGWLGFGLLGFGLLGHGLGSGV